MPTEIEERDQAEIALMADQSALVFAGLLFSGYAIGDPPVTASVDRPESGRRPQKRRIAGAASLREGAPTLLDVA